MRVKMIPYLPRCFLKTFRLIIFFCGLFTVFFITRLSNRPDIASVRYPPQRLSDYRCPCNDSVSLHFEGPIFPTSSILTESRALVLVESIYSRHSKIIVQLLNASKYPYKLETFSKNLPLLTTASKGRFSMVIIENYYKYVNMQRWNRQLLDKYCREYNATIVSFVTSRQTDNFKKARIKGSSLHFWQQQKVRNLEFSPKSLVPFIARHSIVQDEPTPNTFDWVLFEETSGYETVLSCEDENGQKRAAVVRDIGMVDGVNRILLGHNVSYWMMRLAFLDSLKFASQGRFGFDLNRWIQVDIDDIFVGMRGTRMVASDVLELINSQKRLRKKVTNFTYTLGFSGSYFRNGDDLEDSGDELLVESASNFLWFPHMWRHNHAHDHNRTYLEAIMTQNKMFAENMHLPVPYLYSISPQHAGVYPAHSDLYDAWKKVWNVQVTATEEYPHLRPSSDRKGFIHKGIKVLPRQTCGLYTHTQYFHSYPDGIQKLISNVYGGDLFFSIVLNPISIFMTHQQNFAHDRLAVWVFENAVRWIQCWTRLRLEWTDPISSANRYFEIFPDERIPVWNNPCSDPRHRTILPPAFNCSNLTLPNVLIVGPQKTGSTALAAFLSLHPNTTTNDPISHSYEELQFFGGINYEEGLEWYTSKFRPSHTVFEKSATYFDNPKAANQAAVLIPEAKIVVILYDPVDRAYSWYQHMRAHNDSTALSASFEEVLDATDGSLKKLKQRCISGGRYTHHLDRWLEYYPSSQIILVDGQRLKENPSDVMSKLTESLGLSPFDFQSVLRFSPSKGFWCQAIDGNTKCLGQSKGRNYTKMNALMRKRLNKLFLPDNTALHKMLLKYHLAIPSWLPAVLA